MGGVFYLGITLCSSNGGFEYLAIDGARPPYLPAVLRCFDIADFHRRQAKRNKSAVFLSLCSDLLGIKRGSHAINWHSSR
jgi:hypothetical protein